LLKTKLNEIVNTVLEEDISRDELSSLFELTTDYKLKMTYVVEDAFGRKLWRKFSRVMREIDDLFEEYDRWQSQEKQFFQKTRELNYVFIKPRYLSLLQHFN